MLPLASSCTRIACKQLVKEILLGCDEHEGAHSEMWGMNDGAASCSCTALRRGKFSDTLTLKSTHRRRISSLLLLLNTFAPSRPALFTCSNGSIQSLHQKPFESRNAAQHSMLVWVNQSQAWGNFMRWRMGTKNLHLGGRLINTGIR